MTFMRSARRLTGPIYISYLYCQGIVSGYADNTFRPETNTTRAQIAKMVVLGMGWPLIDPVNPTFTDVPPASRSTPISRRPLSTASSPAIPCGTHCRSTGPTTTSPAPN